MDNRKQRKGNTLALALVSLATLSACGTFAYANTTASEVPAGNQPPHLQSIQDVVFPLDAYEPTPEQVGDLTSAMRYALSDCMGRFGFTDYPKHRLKASVSPFPEDRRYLFIEPAKAAQYGYAGAPASELSDKPLKADTAVKSSAPSAEEQAVYLGKGQHTYRSSQIPQGGCLGEARRSVLAGTNAENEWLVTQLRGQASDEAQADARTVEATQQWSACMARSGHAYSDPAAAWEDPRWAARRDGGPLSPEEQKVAQADMQCKLEVNYLGIRSTVEKEVQTRLIASSAERLDKYRADLRVKLSNAAKILAE
ncbi:hypothetical protein ACBI99_36930 [Nonomuraea sp. ATR24]|uniref:hypothetical protein n=1 Tax=Nonomuraea TaxID=83681 RepID=UPI001C5E06A9|nr:hypothetical protein [Nonomuraea ceibae]